MLPLPSLRAMHWSMSDAADKRQTLEGAPGEARGLPVGASRLPGFLLPLVSGGVLAGLLTRLCRTSFSTSLPHCAARFTLCMTWHRCVHLCLRMW